MIRLSPEIPKEALKWRNSVEIYRWCRQVGLLSKDTHEQWLCDISLDKTIKMFGIYADVHAVGVCGFTSIDKHNQTAEFSIYIGPEYHRKGYGHQALGHLLSHGFMDLNLNRIWGETFEDNPATKMFEKLSMKCEGRLRQTYYKNGRYIDSKIYSVLKEEFLGS